MREQLVYLTEAAHRPNISIRIIPASVGNHPGFGLSFQPRRSVVALMNRTFDLYLEAASVVATTPTALRSLAFRARSRSATPRIPAHC